MAHPYVAGQPIWFSVAVYDWLTEAAVTDVPWSIAYASGPGGAFALSTAMAHVGAGLYRGAFTPAAAGDHHLWLTGVSPTTGRRYNAVGTWRVVASALTPPYRVGVATTVLWVVVDENGQAVATAPVLSASADPSGDPVSVTITPSGTTGAYLASFTPDDDGNWSGAATAASTPPRGFSFDVDVSPARVVGDQALLEASLARLRIGAMATDSVRRGDTAVWVWTITRPDGSAFDLTGCTLWFTAKRSLQDADADAALVHVWEDGGAATGITVNDPVDGIAVHTITSAETAALRVLDHPFDIQLRHGNGVVTPVSGTLAVARDATIRETAP